MGDSFEIEFRTFFSEMMQMIRIWIVKWAPQAIEKADAVHTDASKRD
jgi:hypothetical protein